MDLRFWIWIGGIESVLVWFFGVLVIDVDMCAYAHTYVDSQAQSLLRGPKSSAPN